MQLTVLGSGDAFSGCGCNAGYLVDQTILIDCGAPVNSMLHRLAVDFSKVQVVLVTHFHADHIYMLPMFLGRRLFADTGKLLTVAGPVGTKEYVHRIIGNGFGPEIAALILEESQVKFPVLQDGDSWEHGGYRIGAHAVVHSMGPSLAYTVSDGSSTIGFSGDSTHCAGLRRVAGNSDLLVCECSGMEKPAEGGHLWRGDVEQLMSDFPQTQFLLSHLPHRSPVPGALIAHDLLTLDVEAKARR